MSQEFTKIHMTAKRLWVRLHPQVRRAIRLALMVVFADLCIRGLANWFPVDEWPNLHGYAVVLQEILHRQLAPATPDGDIEFMEAIERGDHDV